MLATGQALGIPKGSPCVQGSSTPSRNKQKSSEKGCSVGSSELGATRSCPAAQFCYDAQKQPQTISHVAVPAQLCFQKQAAGHKWAPATVCGLWSGENADNSANEQTVTTVWKSTEQGPARAGLGSLPPSVPLFQQVCLASVSS